MKKLFLTLLGLLVTALSFARGVNELDPKYAKGAVPQDENGRVYFEYTAPIPAGMGEYDAAVLILRVCACWVCGFLFVVMLGRCEH